jgi:SAM-dependent methyltransferase
MTIQNEVKKFWESHPLLDFEIRNESDSARWAKLDEVKRNDVEKFAQTYWRFDKVKELAVLDIGCGPGWLTVQYAKNKANVFAVDLTEVAIGLTRRALEEISLSASLQVASADLLPFANESFDLVVASGSIHHVPNYKVALSESLRVTRKGGFGLITLYRLGILHNPIIFPFVKLLMRLTGTKHPGADLPELNMTVQDFIRQYDGESNPFGIAKSEKAWRSDLIAAGWKIVAVERHFFPIRMSRLLRRSPGFVHKFLDKNFATMVYFTVQR